MSSCVQSKLQLLSNFMLLHYVITGALIVQGFNPSTHYVNSYWYCSYSLNVLQIQFSLLHRELTRRHMSHWTQITHFAHKNIFIIHLLGPKKEQGLRESKSEHFAAAAGHKPSLLVSSSPPRSLPGIVERWYPFSCSDSLPSLPFILLLTILLAWPKHNHSSRPRLIYMFSEALLDKSSPHLFLSTSYYCVIGSHSSLSLSPLFDWPINFQRTEMFYTYGYLMTIVIKLFGVPLVFWLKNMEGRTWRRPDEERQVIIMTTLPLGGKWCCWQLYDYTATFQPRRGQYSFLPFQAKNNMDIQGIFKCLCTLVYRRFIRTHYQIASDQRH